MINSKKLSLFKDGSSNSVGLSDISISITQDDLFNDYNKSIFMGGPIQGSPGNGRSVKTWKPISTLGGLNNDGQQIVTVDDFGEDYATKDGSKPKPIF